MRLGDLLGKEVLDLRGRRLGRVHDLRVLRSGTNIGQFGPRYEVVGLIVGRGSIGYRLGYDRATMTGPLPLAFLFHLLAREAVFVEWDDIAAIADAIHVRMPHPPRAVPELPR